MKPVHLLIILLASVLIFSFALVIAKEDVLRKQPDYRPSAFLSIREVDVKPLDVTSAQIEINVTAYIDHRDGKTRNASMLIRAINSNTGFLETQASANIPDTEAGKTLSVSSDLNIERNGGYELKILIFDNRSIRDSGSVNIRGLGAITPSSKRSGIVQSNIDFMVSNVTKGSVAIKSDIYLENKGKEAESLKMIVKAREAASNLLADKSVTETGIIANDSTVIKSVQLVVPEGYNYMIATELWRGDALINTWEKPVLLAPTKTIPKESVEKKMELEVSKFVREGELPMAPYPTAAPQAAAAPKEPGFELLFAVSSLLAVMMLLRRRLNGK